MLVEEMTLEPRESFVRFAGVRIQIADFEAQALTKPMQSFDIASRYRRQRFLRSGDECGKESEFGFGPYRDVEQQRW